MDDMTRFEERFEERLRAFARTGVQSVDSAAVARTVAIGLDEVHRTRQWAVLGLWRTRSMFRAAVSTAAAVALIAVGGALLSVRDRGDVAAPSPAAQATGSPSQPAVVVTTPAPTSDVLSLDLTWSEVDIEATSLQVAWLRDRFVLVDAGGVVSTSADGATWEVLRPGDPDPGYAELLKGEIATWEDQIVGWYNPEDGPDYTNKPPITARDVLRIVQPPNQPTVTTPFEGRIYWMGVGPAGFVASTHVDDGVTSNSFAWFSPDGIEWTAIPTDLAEVVGVSDGFISEGTTHEDTCTNPAGCSSMLHSADGLTWRTIGHPDADQVSGSARLVPWKGGALVTDGVGVFNLWTSQGYRELPMSADFPAPPEATGPTLAPLATGPLGLVSIRLDSKEVLVTRDGIDWKIQPIPAAMVTDSDHGRPTIAVGERSVLYLTWSGYRGDGDRYVPSLWVGSVEP